MDVLKVKSHPCSFDKIRAASKRWHPNILEIGKAAPSYYNYGVGIFGSSKTNSTDSPLKITSVFSTYN